MPTTRLTAASVPTAERATFLRAVALVLALAWSTVGFATTDLWVVIPPGHPLFAADEAMLEAGWGIYLSCLVVLPLLALVLRPDLGRAVVTQLGVVAACTVPVAALSLDAALLLFGAVLAVTALPVAWPAREGRRRRPGDRRRLTVGWAAATLAVFAGLPWGGFMRTSGDYYPAGSRNGAILLLATVAAAWLLAAVSRRRPSGGPAVRDRATTAVLGVVALGAAPWLVYLWHLCSTARHVDSYLTNGIDHWPAQAAGTLAVLALPVSAVLGRGSVRLAGATAGLTGILLGAFSLLYQDVAASLGSLWGALAIAWGCALSGASLLPARTRSGAGAPAGDGRDPMDAVRGRTGPR
ncbi:hypothetical protein ATJ97_1565 [Georgenia soli]|uniref:Uncharacterized protein n=1 Tax=Georgenia soli TaxID=638953 RepID=A0A2A9ELF6_9MICO|nr:hypothetical protein [Georgenia soli]PFG39070.1 hypothetical protein ATJ97_1565 [Georgenia soli]